MFLSKLFHKRDDPLKPMPLKKIFEIEDKNSFVFEMNKYIGAKCRYGDRMEALSAPERLFYVAQVLEEEVNNGGFDQFFYNSSGNFASELEAAFELIGAGKTAAICGKALAALGAELPMDCEARREWMEENQTDEMTEILGECDEAFFAYEEDLAALNKAFVLLNRAYFT